MDEKKIFISYSRKDTDAIESIISRIEKELYKNICWIDIDGIESGQMFWDIIIKAIRKCSVFLLMASDDSMSSDNVLGEIQIAKNNSKNIVPVIINKGVLKNDRFLAHFPINNYILADNPDHMSRLIHDLKNWCHLDSSEHESVPVEVKNPSADVCLKVLSNLDCKVLIDSEEKTVAPADRLTKIPLPVGEYYAEFISTENSSDAISYEIILEHDKLEKIDLLSLKQTREKAAAEQEKARLEQERLRIESMTLVPYISNNKVGFADLETREIIIPCRYDFVNAFSDGLAKVKINDKWGFVDKSGCEVVSCKYDSVDTFRDGLAKVKINDKWGFVDKSGIEVIPCRYDDAHAFHDGLAYVKKNNKWGYIDKSGCKVIPFKYEYDIYKGFGVLGVYPDFHEGWALVNLNGKYGLIDKSGRKVIPCKYDEAFYFHDDLARVKINDKWGLIDKSGREVIPCRYDRVYDFENGLAQVKINDKWGFVDKSGREVIPCSYDWTDGFHDGLARVEINRKYGFIDKSGREVIPCRYDWTNDLTHHFKSGLAQLRLNDKQGYVDRFGNEMWLEE